jgi:hypothetical protein
MQSKIDQHNKPLVILPDSYLYESSLHYNNWKMYFIVAISLLAFATSYYVYETPYPAFAFYDYETSNGYESDFSLLGLLKGFLPLYLFYVFYTLGKASIVSYSEERCGFWAVACLCLTSHNIGWLVLFNTLQPDNRPGWIGLIIGLILLFLAICFFYLGSLFIKN